jgi:uncharacterized Zn-binding protein involved in type VI secretion
MPKIARQNDTSDHGGGAITTAVQENVTVNGLPIAIAGPGVLGPQGASTDLLYNPSPTVHPLGLGGIASGPSEGSTNITAGGYPVHRFHDARACGAETITASPNVFGNGQAQIRQDGGTVSSPLPSPAAPLGFSYPYEEIIMLKGSPAMYIKDENTPWSLVQGVNDLQFIGTSISPTLQFSSNTEFDIPDLDQSIKTAVGTSDANEEVVLGGLATVGFPSFGNVPIDQLGVIEGIPTSTNFERYFTQNENEWTRNSFAGTSFTVKNESGSQTTTLGIIVFGETIPTVS